jgi:CRISPR-associated endonuclease/helicase Cas3
MLSGMYSKYSVLRLMGLVGSVLVFDEIHAADGYMLSIIEATLELHATLGGSVILLSATLPVAQRLRLLNAWRKGAGLDPVDLKDDGYPLITTASKNQVSATEIPATSNKEIAITACNSEDEVTQHILANARAGKCSAWICNTVSESIERYRLIQSVLGQQVTLFHSRFVADDRAKIEQKINGAFGPGSKDRAGKVVIATQVIEQSLDIDFDLMISDPAPVDLLFQRMGRLHRHDRGQRGAAEFLLHVPKLDSEWDIPTRFVYDQMMPHVWLSTKLLLSKGYVFLPQDMRLMVETVYANNGDETPLGELIDPELPARSFGELASVNVRYGFFPLAQNWLPETAFPTRLGDSSELVVLLRDGVPISGSVHGSTLRCSHRWGLSIDREGSVGWPTVNLEGDIEYDNEIGLMV